MSIVLVFSQILEFGGFMTTIKELPSWYALCHYISVFIEVKVISLEMN